MISGKKDGTHVTVVQKGEDFIDTIIKYCNQNGIESGCLWALGGLEKAVVKGLDNYEPIHYYVETLEGPLELVSAFGNIAKKEEELILHVHGTVSKIPTGITRAGHLGACIANPFIECFIQELAFPLKREFDPKLQTNKIIF